MIKHLKNTLHSIACWTIPGYKYSWECNFLYREIGRLADEIRDDAARERGSRLNTEYGGSLLDQYNKKYQAIEDCQSVNNQTFALERASIYAYWQTPFTSNRKRLREIHSELDHLLQERTLHKLSKNLQ